MLRPNVGYRVNLAWIWVHCCRHHTTTTVTSCCSTQLCLVLRKRSLFNFSSVSSRNRRRKKKKKLFQFFHPLCRSRSAQKAEKEKVKIQSHHAQNKSISIHRSTIECVPSPRAARCNITFTFLGLALLYISKECREKSSIKSVITLTIHNPN